MFSAAAGHAYGRVLMFQVGSEVCHAKISQFGFKLIIQKYVCTEIVIKDKQDEKHHKGMPVKHKMASVPSYLVNSKH